MKKIRALALAGLLMAGMSSVPALAEPGTPHVRLYGGEPLKYRVYRNDSPVGTYTVTFREVGDRLEVDTVFEISISFLFLSYDYKYVSTCFWQDGEMIAMESEVDDNGDLSTVRALRQEDRWVIDGPKGREVVSTSPALFATTHWNPDVVGVDRILNTITGEVAEVTMTDHGRRQVAIGSATRTIEAQHWVYSGELETNVFYDDDGRWVGMEFEGKDGSEFRVVPEHLGAPGAV